MTQESTVKVVATFNGWWSYFEMTKFCVVLYYVYSYIANACVHGRVHKDVASNVIILQQLHMHAYIRLKQKIKFNWVASYGTAQMQRCTRSQIFLK